MKLNKLWLLSGLFIFSSLIISVAFNLLLFNRAKQYYLELNQTRLDPIGLNKYPISPENSLENNLTRVVLFGDSRAASWTSPDLETYQFINRGIGSQTSIQTLERFNAHIAPLKPDIIIIQVGVNDLKTIALFPHKKQAIIENCKNNIQQIVEQSQQLNTRVILTTIFPIGKVPLERQPFWSDEIGEAINQVNTYLKTLASENIIILDTFPILANNQNIVLSEYQADELHLNRQGYIALNQALTQLLDKNLSYAL
jgi:lysophospholipase L1-like esterase